MTRGTVIGYDETRGEGYIKPDEDEDRIPFDRDSLIDFAPDERPQAGDRVSFDIEGGMAGLWAKHVRRVD